MPRLPVVHHLLLEELQVLLVVPVHLQQADGHLAVPAALVHLPPAALSAHRVRHASFPRAPPPHAAHLADELPQLQLLVGDVPLLQVDAGLAGLAGDGAAPALRAAAPADARGQLLQLVLVLQAVLSAAPLTSLLVLRRRLCLLKQTPSLVLIYVFCCLRDYFISFQCRNEIVAK